MKVGFAAAHLLKAALRQPYRGGHGSLLLGAVNVMEEVISDGEQPSPPNKQGKPRKKGDKRKRGS
jgi:hypothetical protein